jgi:L-ribulose-5-phosphate 3-epimerase
MTSLLSRRGFLASAASFAAAAAFDTRPSAQRAEVTQIASPVFKTKPHKALIQDRPTEAYLREVKAAGFEGLEARTVPPAEAEQIRRIAEGLGMRIHSVIRGTAAFNSPDRALVDQSFAQTEDAIRSAQAFGADTVLLVPCRIEARTAGGFGARNGILMPRPWEFQLEFDAKTGHVSRVVSGDNTPYADYIRAQNLAVDTSTEMVKRLIPLAEKTGVVIALENVWNNLWVRPAYFKHFVESFQSPWIRAYFDIGNHVKFGPPEEWILALRSLIVKIHVKDYRLNPSDADGQGSFVDIREGSVRWPIIRTALEEIGYNGWMTIEAPVNPSVTEQSQRLDLILAGK